MRHGKVCGLLAVALAVAACGGSAASPSPTSGPPLSPTPTVTAGATVRPIPAASHAVPTPAVRPTAGGTVYVIKKGDALSVIAIRHKVTLKALLAANPGIPNINVIKIGQKIIIPRP